MNFSWSDEQNELYEGARKLAASDLKIDGAPGAAATFEPKKWRALADAGVLGLSVPTKHGGLGFDRLTSTKVMEGLGAGAEDLGILFSASAHLFATVMPIVEHAEDVLKERYVRNLAGGRWIGANAISEAQAGSDVFALRTQARREGDRYILNGEKSYVTNAPVADVFLVYATTKPADGFLGVSAFVVERGFEGVEVGQSFERAGLQSSPASMVYFSDCEVPVQNRVGAEGQGAAIFRGSMNWERVCLFSIYAGMLEQQLDRTLEYASRRKQGGRPIGKNQAVSHRIVDMKIRLDTARLLQYRAAWLADQGADAVVESSIAKLAVSEAAQASSLNAMQIHGAMGTHVDSGLERMLRDSLPSTVFSGTSEIQRELIARGLGL